VVEKERGNFRRSKKLRCTNFLRLVGYRTSTRTCFWGRNKEGDGRMGSLTPGARKERQNSRRKKVKVPFFWEVETIQYFTLLRVASFL
jgi:hypothetical protein